MTWRSDEAGLESPDCIERLENTARAVEAELRRWQHAGVLVVPDTNVFLHVLDAPIAEAGWRALAELRPMNDVTVVLLVAVIDELDKAKRGNQRTKARTVLREIDQLLGEHASAVLSTDTADGQFRLEVMVYDLDHEPLPQADREIIDRTLALVCRAPNGVLLLTSDTGMAIRARHAGLSCAHLATPDR